MKNIYCYVLLSLLFVGLASNSFAGNPEEEIINSFKNYRFSLDQPFGNENLTSFFTKELIENSKKKYVWVDGGSIERGFRVYNSTLHWALDIRSVFDYRVEVDGAGSAANLVLHVITFKSNKQLVTVPFVHEDGGWKMIGTALYSWNIDQKKYSSLPEDSFIQDDSAHTRWLNDNCGNIAKNSLYDCLGLKENWEE